MYDVKTRAGRAQLDAAVLKSVPSGKRWTTRLEIIAAMGAADALDPVVVTRSLRRLEAAGKVVREGDRALTKWQRTPRA